MGVRTGYKGWHTLEEYDTFHGTPTGRTKPNVPSDPDYVQPVYDPDNCAPQEEFLLFTTVNNSIYPTNMTIWFNQFSGPTIPSIDLVIRKGTATINEVAIPVGGPAPEPLDLVENGVSVYIKTEPGQRDNIFQISIDGVGGSDWGINSVYPNIFPELTKLTVTGQKQLTTIDISSNVNIDILELDENGLSGHLNTSMLPLLSRYSFYGNSLITISSLNNHPALEYFNCVGNGLTTHLIFTPCTDIEYIYAGINDLWLIEGLSDKTKLRVFNVPDNPSLSQPIDLSASTVLEEVNADSCPITDISINSSAQLKVFIVSNNTIPQSKISSIVAAAKPTLEVFTANSMPQLVSAINLDGATNLYKLWVSDNPNLLGISWSGANLLKDVNLAGMSSLSHTINFAGNPVNGFVWLTGANITSANLDSILNYISSLNIPPVQEHPVGPGAIIYGDWESATGTITPTSASLAAYNDLVSRGYTIIGPVPGS